MAWLTGYGKRKKITLTGGSSGAQTDYQIKLTVAYDSDMQADFDDVRFTESDGSTLVSAWLESKTDSSTAVVVVKFPTTPASSATEDYYMYYNQIGIDNNWNGANTFDFFDDFIVGWEKDATNPVLTHSTGANDEDSNQIYGGRIVEEDDEYRMYYIGNQAPDNHDQVFLATTAKTNNFKNWTKYETGGDVKPILGISEGTGFDSSNTYLRTILKESDTSYKMWYIGDDYSSGHYLRVGYATSTDGISWTKYSTDPIYADLTVNSHGTEFFQVLKVDSTHYYAAVGHYTTNRVDLLESSDGISWSSLATNVISAIQPTDFKKIGSTYYIYGHVSGALTSVKCYTATSLTGSWTDRGTQITALGSGWEQRTYHASIFEISTGQYVMSYCGWDGSIRPEIGIATLDNTVPYIESFANWTTVGGTPSVLDGELFLNAEGETIRSTDSFSSNHTLEGKYRIPGAYSAFIGLSNSTTVDPYPDDAAFIQIWSTPAVHIRSWNDGTMTTVDRGDQYTHTTKSFMISHRGSTIRYEWEDGTYNETLSTNIPDEDMYIYLKNHEGAGTYFDDIRISKYVSNPATYGFGTEELPISGWSGTIIGVSSPASVMGIIVDDITSVIGIL